MTGIPASIPPGALAIPGVRGVPVVYEVVAAGLVSRVPAPAGESGRERGVLHPAYLMVAVRKMGRPVSGRVAVF